MLIYRDDIQKQNISLVQLINNLQYGIDQEQFTLVFQPQFNLDTGEIIGMEALVRWLDPEEGLIPPSKFIPLAEQTGQIYRLERIVMKKALEQKRKWEKQGFGNLALSINLSSKTLTSASDFHEQDLLLDSYQVDYSKIVIEITETAYISDVEAVTEHLQWLKRRGIKIALDDFGTGYSSLNYLKKLPIDIIKLDRSFVHSITDEGLDSLMIKNILSLAHDLKFEVIAEGIETHEQLEYLRAHSCEMGQGYLLSRPLPEESIRTLLISKYRYME